MHGYHRDESTIYLLVTGRTNEDAQTCEATCVHANACCPVYAARDVDTGILDHASRYDASRDFLSAYATGRYGPLISGQSRTLTFSLLEATEVYHVPLAALDEIERTAPENARAIHAISDLGVAVSMSVV